MNRYYLRNRETGALENVIIWDGLQNLGAMAEAYEILPETEALRAEFRASLTPAVQEGDG